MTVSYGKGARGKATKLHSQLVRSRGACEACGKTQNLQAAHIVPRRYANTRTSEANAFCLCAACHRHFTEWPIEFTEFVYRMIGVAGYEDLYREAHKLKKMDWEEECERLGRLFHD